MKNYITDKKSKTMFAEKYRISEQIEFVNQELNDRVEAYLKLIEDGNITKAEANRRHFCLLTLLHFIDPIRTQIHGTAMQTSGDVLQELDRWASAVQSSATAENRFYVAKKRERIFSLKEFVKFKG